MNLNELKIKENKYILQTYKRQDVCFVRGKGKYLWDSEGKKYLDFFTGISVCNLGHCNPYINKSVHKQIEKLIHISNHYYIKPQVELAQKLIENSFKRGKVFFSNSGAEANECAIKIARKYGNRRGAYEIISFKNSFHGRTIATLSATGQTKFHIGFNPLLEGFKYAEFNKIESVEKLINKKTCAVIIEPIQGEGGIYPADKRFLKELRLLCNKYNLILIFDEIQCGMGRTGKLFAYQYYNVVPDIFTIAKSISNGFPLGVTVVNEKFCRVLDYGDHGSTFGGNIISCIAAIKMLDLINSKVTLRRVNILGKYFIDKLNILKKKYSIIKDVRGIGLMLGIELKDKATPVVKGCLLKGVVINCTSENVLRFLPPFIINKKDIDTVVNVVESEIKKLEAQL